MAAILAVFLALSLLWIHFAYCHLQYFSLVMIEKVRKTYKKNLQTSVDQAENADILSQ